MRLSSRYSLLPVTQGIYSSSWTKGFAISSLPSTGLMSTRRVPRATRRPRGLVDVLPSSSGKNCQPKLLFSLRLGSLVQHTTCVLSHVIENEVHELVVTFQDTSDYANVRQSTDFGEKSDCQAHRNRSCRAATNIPSLPPLNLTMTSLSMYLLKSRMFSRFGRSAACPAPPAEEPPLPPLSLLPPLPPRPPPRPPRN